MCLGWDGAAATQCTQSAQHVTGSNKGTENNRQGLQHGRWPHLSSPPPPLFLLDSAS